MKSAIYLGKENVEVREVPVPEIGDNDVLIQNIYSSICGTDVVVYRHGANTGHKVTVGGEFGHETVSRIVKIGKNITDFKVGDRVYPYPLPISSLCKRRYQTRRNARRFFGVHSGHQCKAPTLAVLCSRKHFR